MKYPQPSTISAVAMIRSPASSRVAERRVDAAKELLQQEAADARAGVDRRQDEQRLEHDREVIPVRHQAAHARQCREDLRHADGQRHRAAGAPGDVSPTAAFEHRRG